VESNWRRTDQMGAVLVDDRRSQAVMGSFAHFPSNSMCNVDDGGSHAVSGSFGCLPCNGNDEFNDHSLSHALFTQPSQVSRGSKNHNKGQCRPCRFFLTFGSCPDGALCNHCHLPHTNDKVMETQVYSVLARIRRMQATEKTQRKPKKNRSKKPGVQGSQKPQHEDPGSKIGGEPQVLSNEEPWYVDCNAHSLKTYFSI